MLDHIVVRTGVTLPHYPTECLTPDDGTGPHFALFHLPGPTSDTNAVISAYSIVQSNNSADASTGMNKCIKRMKVTWGRSVDPCAATMLHADAANSDARVTKGAAMSSAIPQPIRGEYGASDPGPRNVELDRQNPDILVPPTTDNGSIPNLKFSFGMAHNRLESGGWAREVTVRELPAAKGLAGVDMRLGPGVVRELHWHKEAEWGYVLEGRCRVTVVDPDRNVFIDDLKAGDIWLFPSGTPHSIQALKEGCEFLLVFDDGNFSENETLLVTEVMAHMPRDVIAKNFGISAEHFADLPPKEKYIFPLPVPPPLAEVLAKLPKQRPAMPYTVHGGDFTPTRWDGGKTTIIDVKNFPVTNMAALIIDLEPGAMREIHWHPDADEWQYYITGEARMTVFDATSKARTFNYRAGDVGYVPKTLAHYIENIGTTNVRVLNVFNKPEFKDIALNQWLALTPADLVRGHLNLNDTAMAALNPNRRSVVR